MKITDYPKTETLDSNDTLLVAKSEREGATKGILGSKLKESLGMFQTADEFYEKMDDILLFEQRKDWIRGKNLGTAITEEQRAEIEAGTFHGLWLGDYWVIPLSDPSYLAPNKSFVTLRIVDFDYWMTYGDQPPTEHHIVISHDEVIRDGWDTSAGTLNGYFKLKSDNIALFKKHGNILMSPFGGIDYVLSHRIQKTNGVNVSSNSITGYVWENTNIDLLTYPMLYGVGYQRSTADLGSNTTLQNTVMSSDNKQLAYYKHVDPKQLANRVSFTTRDLTGDNRNWNVSQNNQMGIDPLNKNAGHMKFVFGIKGTPN